MNIVAKLESEIKEKFGETLKKPIEFNGKVIRQDALYIFAHEFIYKGNMSQVINFGSWKFGKEYTIKSWEQEQEKDKNFIKAYKQKTQKVRAEIDIQKQKKQKECKEKWTKIFGSATPANNHDYLEFKGVKSYGLRTDRNGVLLIPCRDINGLTGVQRIYKDPESNKFEKRFSSGIKIKGSIHALKTLKNSKYCYLSEGYATAATIQDLYPDIPSVCCFNAGNISNAIQTIRLAYPDINIIIAGDNDHANKDNVGIKYAYKAQRRYKNVVCKFPKFSVKNPDWTDFNDLCEFDSRESAIQQLAFSSDEFASIEYLGHNDGNYFYISSENQQIICLNYTQHNKAGFRRLFAKSAYWIKNYGIEVDDNIKVNWDYAAEDLISKCHEKGIFDPSQVRGIGVWQDSGHYTINDGESILNGNPETKYNYQKTVKVNYDLKPYNKDDMIHLLQAFKSLEYKNKNDYFYLSAWFIQSQIFATLPWRFHIWLTGSAGSGKSTILKWLNDLSMNNILTNNTTSAGIRQTAKSNAVSIIYDEAEPTDDNTRQVVDLAREMSSNGSYKTMRGTVSGNALNYNTQCVFCFGSIQVAEMNQADRSRIFTIEMNQTENQEEETFEDIFLRFSHFIKKKNEVFSYIYHSIDSIKYNIEFCKKNLKVKSKIESRLADQLSVAMACFYVFLSQEKMDQVAFDNILSEFNLIDSEYTDQNNEKEHESCYEGLMSVIIDHYTKTTVAQAIHNIRYCKHETESEIFQKMLGVHGLKYFPEEEHLFVSSKNTHLREKLKDYSDITRILRRDTEMLIKDKDRVLITQLGNVRGIRIKLKV